MASALQKLFIIIYLHQNYLTIDKTYLTLHSVGLSSALICGLSFV